ncbi:E3 ubiquitin-protein ligase RNFT1 [Lemmus lemmus]
MQASCSQLHDPPGTTDDAPASQCIHPSRSAEGSSFHPGDIQIQINSGPKDYPENPSSRNIRSGACSCAHGHSHSEARPPDDFATESGEHGSGSFSEFRYLFKWLQKSLPYILILGIKLVMQHITGISLGIGLLTTFMYANKSIVNQAFLRERSSKIQCAWLLVFLAGSSILLYYTFHSQSLYYSLIFLNPTLDQLSFWEVLWIVGITDFVLKFFFMGLKCLIILVPSFIMPFKSKGYWYMLLEELCQCYRIFVPIPVWFRYLISYGEFGNVTRWSLGILLALLYLILKLLDFFGHLRTFRQVLRVFFTRPYWGLSPGPCPCAATEPYPDQFKSRFSRGTCNGICLHRVMECLPARDSVQMWMAFVQYVKLNFRSQFFSFVSIYSVKNALPYGLTERKLVHSAEL